MTYWKAVCSFHHIHAFSRFESNVFRHWPPVWLTAWIFSWFESHKCNITLFISYGGYVICGVWQQCRVSSITVFFSILYKYCAVIECTSMRNSFLFVCQEIVTTPLSRCTVCDWALPQISNQVSTSTLINKVNITLHSLYWLLFFFLTYSCSIYFKMYALFYTYFYNLFHNWLWSCIFSIFIKC